MPAALSVLTGDIDASTAFNEICNNLFRRGTFYEKKAMTFACIVSFTNTALASHSAHGTARAIL